MDTRKARALAKQYADVVAKDMAPDKIVLYGSTATGTRTEDSDIDVAVIFDGFKGDWLQTFTRLSILRKGISYIVEPILLDVSNDRSGFAKHILKTGEVLYQR